MSEEPPSPRVGISVVARDPAWRMLLNDPEEVAHRAARATLHLQATRAVGLGARCISANRHRPGPLRLPAELSLVLADDRLVQGLNRDYRGRDRPTNVLSFSGLDREFDLEPDQPCLLGDVVLARETIAREAREQGKTPSDHLAHLVVHGVLHLLGYDHQTPTQAVEMEGLERSVLADLGIADPYRDRSPSATSSRGS